MSPCPRLYLGPVFASDAEKRQWIAKTADLFDDLLRRKARADRGRDPIEVRTARPCFGLAPALMPAGHGGVGKHRI